MMVLYSGSTDPFSHRCRFVLHEKGCDFEVNDIDMYNKPPEIDAMNPYGEVPILIERDLTLYQSTIINEYIDERFPHPQLMPADPIMRARARLFIYTFERELFSFVRVLENRNETEKRKSIARHQIAQQLTQIAPIFDKNTYLMGSDFTMLDITIAPLLWRLGYYGIDLPKTASSLLKYAERVFARPAFIDSMTPSEKVMRR
ncbi:MAG: glutathione S-transferase N-terminal domain-containing protein [Duodenibacillus sp.]|nr:glutathione S-transferase N-terminal domain-containing protein [Duodenibacillus sp.]HBC69991.1 glutathione S-transferase [Sutterella sp.]